MVVARKFLPGARAEHTVCKMEKSRRVIYGCAPRAAMCVEGAGVGVGAGVAREL